MESNTPRLDDVKQERVRDALPDLIRVRLLELLDPEHVEVLLRVRVSRAIGDDDAVALTLRHERGILHRR